MNVFRNNQYKDSTTTKKVVISESFNRHSPSMASFRTMPTGSKINRHQSLVCVHTQAQTGEAINVLGTYASKEIDFQAFGITKEESTEWGWFADIESSSESCSGENSLTALRRKYSVDAAENHHVLCDETVDSRVSAALKTFSVRLSASFESSVTAAIAIPKFRIVQASSGADRHAEYLVTFKLGKDFYCSWKRHSEFISLIKGLPPIKFSRAIHAWESIETRWFNRLELSYIHQKCVQLENFIRELMYESTDPAMLIEFLGGAIAILNTRPEQGVPRPSAQLPKDLRPRQPTAEREMFEKMYAENFRRSSVTYDDPITVA